MTMNVHSAEMNTRRLTGMGTVATLALAVLVFGCVLAATAGPREALNIRTEALYQTVARIPRLGQTITVSTTWGELIGSVYRSQDYVTFTVESKVAARALAALYGGTVQVSTGGPGYVVITKELVTLADGDLSDLEGEFARDFNGRVLHLAPVSADWVSMTSSEYSVDSALSGTGDHAVEMEVSYRLPHSGYLRVLAGSLSASAPAAFSHIAGYFPTINVAVTQQTASKFGLKVGSAVQTAGPQRPSSGTAPPITLKVAAIVAENQPASSFWEDDPSLAAPELNVPGTSPSYWTSGVFALPNESAAVQQDYGPSGLNVQWVLPVNLGALLGDQAQALGAALQRIVSVVPPLTGLLAPVATSVTVSTGLQQPLAAFIGAAAAVDALLRLLYVSLAVIAAIVLLLAARMIVLRRTTELALRRARGASLLQTGLAAGRGAAIGCVPAAVLAGAVAVLLVPGQAPPGGWWPGLSVLVIAVGAPAVLVGWQQRLPRSGRGRAAGGYSRPGQRGLSQPSLGYGALGYGRRGRRRFRGGGRLVVEVTAVLAAIAGIVVFRQQGTQPGTAVNLYTSAAPALVAIPAVIVVLRIYPLILRGLLRGAARGRSATGFLGLALAARAALTLILPAFALVLAITVAAFAGMVRNAVTRGEINASWQAAGADVTVSNFGLTGFATATPSASGAIPAAAQRAFAAVPGVQHAAVVSAWLVTAPGGALVTAVAVDPASYSALVASSRTWPDVNPRLLTGDGVLASPRAVADFGGLKTVTLISGNGGAPIRVRVAGTLSGTPAPTEGGAFVLMPESLVAHELGVVPNLMLLNGPGIDTATLTALANKMVPTAAITSRSELLRQLTGAPVQRGAFLVFALALAAAAGLGLAVMLLQLALGAADREANLARLATMGLGGRQRSRLVLLEVLPAVIAAAVAAVASALVLPRIVAPAINLSVFTGSSAGVPLVPDVASVALPIAGLIVVAAVSLTIEIRARRGVVSTLRGGE
jgi:putative ABC transport system permease protein